MENHTHATTSTQFALRPFRVDMPDEAIADLRRRIAATRWPDKETVADQSQGVQLATMKELVRYWGADHDWRKVEAKLNALPQFVTEIDGLDIHFIHVRSNHEDALPLIVTHGLLMLRYTWLILVFGEALGKVLSLICSSQAGSRPLGVV